MKKPKIDKARLMTLPSLIIIFTVTLIPICYSLFISLTDYNLTILQPPNFIGLGNFREALNDSDFYNAVINTIKIAIPALFFELVLGFMLALILNRKFLGRGLVITFLVTPVMIAPGAAALAWRLLFDPNYGPVNYFISQLAGRRINIDWLGSVDLAFRSVTIVDIWQTTPFVMLVLLAGLSAISPEMYEAARIDGANSIRSFRYITLPLVKPVMTVAILFRAIDLIKMFDICYALTKGGPSQTTKTISYFTYEEGLKFMRIGYGSALSFIILVSVAVLAALLIRTSMKGEVN